MVHVVAALGRAPIGIVLQKLDIEPIEAARRPDVEGAFADLLDGRDARERQEETEMVREVRVGAGDGLAARQVLGLEVTRRPSPERTSPWPLLVAGLAFSAARVSGTVARRRRQRYGYCWSGERRRDPTCSTRPSAALDRGLLVPEGFEEGNGNSPGSNGCSASAEMASSISTGFITPCPNSLIGLFLTSGAGYVPCFEQLGGGFPREFLAPLSERACR